MLRTIASQRQRKERERQGKLAQARIDRLLDEAASPRHAANIRAYVDAVEHEVERQGSVASHDEIARWARAQTDTLDDLKAMTPVKNKRGAGCGALETV